ncbi:MAG: tRNA (guanosine(37)-N1)-methyltransferase TrmD [Candidatus Pacebacteria bacterium]|nr:tRNA (guanosine(37)-N1)-methyltransferase TrmD [Candidatus Paceibacterota bacterium]
MMRFDILTIFPEVFKNYFDTSIIKRAQSKKIIEIYIHNLRKWTTDPHQSVDDVPYGGGKGMIFKVEPIYKAVKDLKKQNRQKARCRVILFSPKGEKLNQSRVKKLSQYRRLILICPRYEGVDERVAKYIADEEISIGDYVLTGGELPAMVLIDSITRLLPGVINKESLLEESFAQNFKLEIPNSEFLGEYPQYTRPAVFYPEKGNKKIAWRVPSVLLSGDHQKIQQWKQKHFKKIKS